MLRALVVKQMHGFSYRALAFHLADSRTYRSFCRLGWSDPEPSKSALAAAIKAVRAETVEGIHRGLLAMAAAQKIESGGKVRVDTTVVESPIHWPSDSELLWDGVRVLTRLMQRARELLGERCPASPNACDGLPSYGRHRSGARPEGGAPRRGLEIGDMTRSAWVYKQLRDFRAGIEGVISRLKRVFGLDRCTWRSLPSFHANVWSSILSFNLLVLARHQLL